MITLLISLLVHFSQLFDKIYKIFIAYVALPADSEDQRLTCIAFNIFTVKFVVLTNDRKQGALWTYVNLLC